MPFNGSGTYELPAGNPVVTSTTISSTVHNNTNSDIATALTNTITKDGQSVPTANLPMGGYKFTDLSAGAGNGESVRWEQVGDLATSQLATTVVFKSSATGSAKLPVGTTAQRDGTPDDGYLRFNSSLTALETWYSSAWNTLATTANAVLTTGNQTIAGIKTFSSPVGVGAATASGDAVQKSQVYQLGTKSCVRLNTANGYGSTNTKIRRFTNTVTNTGTDITYADSATLGASFTINTDGIYAITYGDQFAIATWMGLSLNSTQLTTDIYAITITDVLVATVPAAAGSACSVSTTLSLSAGDIVRPHGIGTASGVNIKAEQFTITRVA